MPAQIRPNRLDLSDRFPMLGFTIRTDGSPQRAEVALATEPGLFTDKSRRTASNFFSTRETGQLTIARGEAVYVVPPEILARFIGAEKIYFGLATAPAAGGNFTVAAMPNEASPYVSIAQMSDRSMRRVRLFPNRQQRASGYDGAGKATLEWAGDTASPGLEAAGAPANGAKIANGGAAAPQPPAASAEPMPYDDGFGPLPTPPAEAPAAAAPQPAASPSPAASSAQSLARALDAGTVAISPDQQAVTPPSARRLSTFEKIAIEAALSALPPPLGPLVIAARAAANTAGVSVGIGPAVSAGLLGGLGAGVGLIFAPNNELGAYGQLEVSAGLIASIGATMQLTVISGGIESFSGIGYAAGFSAGEGVTGGAAVLFDANRNFQGVTLQAGVGAGLSPVDIYTSVQRQVSTTLGYAKAFSADPLSVDIKYRMFIPSPLIDSPLAVYGGDGRGFSYDGGHSRGEIHATVRLTPGGGIAGIDLANRHWGPSTIYATEDSYAPGGKPDWWLEKRDGAQPTRTETLGATDDNLRIYAGAPGTTRSIQAMTESASIVSIYASGSNPLATGAPAIDADMTVFLRLSGGGVEAKAVGSHDGFPAHELYVNGSRVYAYDPVAAGNGPTALFPPEDIDVDTSWTSVTATSMAQGLAYKRQVRTFDAEIPLDPGVGGRSIGMDALEIGDIILSTTSEIPSRIIRLGTGSAISHAMLYVGQGGQVVEAIGDGVVLRPLEQAIGAATVATAFRLPGLTDTERQQIADAAAVHLGKPYNYLGIVRQAAFQIDQRACALLPGEAAERCRQFVGQIDLGAGTNDQFFCSQLILEAYRAIGKPISNEEPHWASPDDIAQLSMRRGVLAYVGHLKAPPLERGFFGQTLSVSRAMSHSLVRPFGGQSFTINWDDVELLPQREGLSCWAASAAMVVGWNERVSIDESTIARVCGRDPAQRGPILDADVRQFARSLGLVVEPEQSYSEEGFRRLLENYGPVWVTKQMSANQTGFDQAGHDVVVVGMYSDGNDTYLRIADPWDRVVGTPGTPGAYLNSHASGSRYIMRYADFMREYEWQRGLPGNDGLALLQMMHAPDTSGRTPNYGDARGVGYAQSLTRAMEAPILAGLQFATQAWAVSPPQGLDMAAPDGLPPDQQRDYWKALLRELVGPQTAAKLESLPAVAQDRGWTIALGAGARPGVALPSAIGSGLGIDPAGTPFTFGIGRIDGGTPVDPFDAGGMAKVTDNRPLFTIIEGPRDGMMGFARAVALRTADRRLQQGAALLRADGSFMGASFALEVNGLKAEDAFDAIKLGYAQTPAQFGSFIQPLGRMMGRAGTRLFSNEAEGPAPGTIISRSTVEKPGIRYDLAQLSGIVPPQTMPLIVSTQPMPGERVVLDDWPYIDGPSGRSCAAVAINWAYEASGVGNIAIEPVGGQAADGWSIVVTADIAPPASPPTQIQPQSNQTVAQLLVTVRTVFSKPGEPDQTGVSVVTLSGNGRFERRHEQELPQQRVNAN